MHLDDEDTSPNDFWNQEGRCGDHFVCRDFSCATVIRFKFNHVCYDEDTTPMIFTVFFVSDLRLASEGGEIENLLVNCLFQHGCLKPRGYNYHGRKARFKCRIRQTSKFKSTGVVCWTGQFKQIFHVLITIYILKEQDLLTDVALGIFIVVRDQYEAIRYHLVVIKLARQISSRF